MGAVAGKGEGKGKDAIVGGDIGDAWGWLGDGAGEGREAKLVKVGGRWGCLGDEFEKWNELVELFDGCRQLFPVCMPPRAL